MPRQTAAPVVSVAASSAAPIFVPHRRQGDMLPGRLLARPNRFLGQVELAGGAVVEAHIGDRGRLTDILFPGAEVYVIPAAGPARRTAFTLVCARCPVLVSTPAPPPGQVARGPLCCLDPAFANRLVRALLDARALPELLPYGGIHPEVRVGASRFDFALDRPAGRSGARRLLLEVKNVGVASGRAALFPDAPSVRAVRHASELAALARDGQQAAILLCAQRADVDEIRPHPVDPTFAHALRDAQEAGVQLLGVAFEVRLDGFHYAGPRPVIPHLLA